MRKIILLAHISLDSFVAWPNGQLDGFDPSEENLQFVCSLTKNADAALFGRVSYALLNDYWPTAAFLPDATAGMIAFSNWYNNAQKMVISKTLADTGTDKITIINNDVIKGITKIKQQTGKDILIFGSPSVSQMLIQAGLIDNYWIFINPVIFGKGISLFNGTINNIKLKLESTRQFSNGEFGLYYKHIKGN
ncbi:MAG TPA: dihydrofolate reductase family protein [Puia sp.]|nr:dihydrofolate reductase family protein [Puia sp.]